MRRSIVLALLALLPALPAPKSCPRLAPGLTPVGAEQGASKDGRHPGLERRPSALRQAQRRVPHDAEIDGDKPLFVITHDNYANYADRLTAGHRELLRRFAITS